MPKPKDVKPAYLSYTEFVAWKENRARRNRRAWSNLALFASLLAVGLEASFHLCASTLFDPLPDVVTGVAYAWVIFFLWFNRVTLEASADEKPAWNPLVQWLGAKRSAGIALAGTSIAILVAAMATWMFAPFLVLAPFLIVSIIGSLLLVPVLDLVVLVTQFKSLRRIWNAREGSFLDKRVALGTGVLWLAAGFFLIVRPTLIGHWLVQALDSTGSEQQKAFRGLRFVHGEEAMLDLTYHRNPPYWVSLGYKGKTDGYWPWVGYSWGSWRATDARRTYFLMTGTPFESVPRPASSWRQNMLGQPDDVAIEETGGYVVGRPVPDVSVKTSQMQFTTNARSETAQGTWTLTFRNNSHEPQEARADILLPLGATCDQVSLWVNGIEKPAAFGAPQKVRAAYQQVAVVQRRDPLLVTLPAPGHLLAQCFPVPARGEMKIKIGITTPLTWQTVPGQAPQLVLTAPAFGPVNFMVPSGLTHQVTLSPSAENVALQIAGSDIFTTQTFAVASERALPRVGDALAPGFVRTENPLARVTRPLDVWVVLDASEGMNGLMTGDVFKALRQSLAALPDGSTVQLADTRLSLKNSGRKFYPADFRSYSSNLLPEKLHYKGGADAAPALQAVLAEARRRKAAGRGAAVIFLHAATPANVSDLGGVRRELQQSLAQNGPTLVTVQLAPRAQDAIAMDLGGFPNVYASRALPGDPKAVADAMHFAAMAAQANHSPVRAADTTLPLPLGGRLPAVNGAAFTQGSVPKAAGENLARLYQAGLTTSVWLRSNITGDAAKAFDLRFAGGQPAATMRLVTPVSSAVVLESQAQYEANGLDDKDGKKGFKDAKIAPGPETTKVNAPEPASGLLVMTALGLVPYLCHRRAARRQAKE